MRYPHIFSPVTILSFDCGSQFFRLSLKNGLIDCVSKLICDQEEANTKGFLYTKHAEALGVSATWYFNSRFGYCNIRTVFSFVNIETRTSDRWREIDVKNVISEIREKVCLAFLSFEIDKVKTLEILTQSEHHIKTFKAIRAQFTWNAELSPFVEQLCVNFYGLSQSFSTTEACSDKFCSKKKAYESQKLPPTRNTLLYYIKRELYSNSNPKITYLLFCHTLPVWGLCLDNQGWFVLDLMDVAGVSSQWLIWTDILQQP